MLAKDTIGGLAKAAGVGVETVRYYQRRGLLPEPARPPGEEGVAEGFCPACLAGRFEVRVRIATPPV